MISYADLTDRSAVEWAMAEFDRLGREQFLHNYGFKEAREYFLVTDAGRYDSKAIFASAYGRQHGSPISWDEFSGGKDGAAGRLAELGFTVEGIDEVAGRRTFDSFDEALRHYAIPMENLPLIREFLVGRKFTEFYIPRSGSYISAVPADGIKKAFIHSGYIWHRVEKGVGEVIELPVNRVREGGYWRNSRAERPVQTCDVHFLELPVSGVCPYC